MGRAVKLHILAGGVKRFLQEDVKNYLVVGGKKPLLDQMREFADLWKRYDSFPYHYLKNDLFLREIGDSYRDYFPSVFADDFVMDVNPPACRDWLEDKFEFDARMRQAGLPMVPTLALAVVRDGAVRLSQADGGALTLEALHQSARAQGLPALFVKPRHGLQGLGAFKLDVAANGFARKGQSIDGAGLAALLRHDGFDDFLVQPFFRQHDELNRLNPHSVNSLRVMTMMTGERFDLLCAYLRVGGAGSETDNGSHGGFYVRVDLGAGAVAANAKVQLTFAKRRIETVHPVTGVPFGSVRLPHGPAVIDVVERAARAFAPVRVIGWDVALGPEGPCFIEGNFYPGFRPVQDICGGLMTMAIGHEIAARRGWESATPAAVGQVVSAPSQ